MSVYTRFKRAPDGFRSLVELLESTPMARRQKMIDVGMAEDAAYTEMALKYVLTFDDVAQLPDLELAEVVAKAPAKMIAYALHSMEEDVVERFLKNAKPQVAAEIRDFIAIEIGLGEIGGARLKLITTARELERQGRVRVKRIPTT